MDLYDHGFWVDIRFLQLTLVLSEPRPPLEWDRKRQFWPVLSGEHGRRQEQETNVKVRIQALDIYY